MKHIVVAVKNNFAWYSLALFKCVMIVEKSIYFLKNRDQWNYLPLENWDVTEF